jgi:rod shape-determining protein MreC
VHLSRRISENRPILILAVVTVLCLASLATGATGNIISNAIATAGSVIAYPFWLVLDRVEAGVSHTLGLVTEYDAARKQNKEFELRINQLTSKLDKYEEVEEENKRLREMVYFRDSQHRLDLMAADVLPLTAGTIAQSGGVLVINRGSIHGVVPGMCAMTNDGVLGVVTETLTTMSYVATLLSDRCKIGAMIGRDRRIRATLHGSGNDSDSLCRLEHIDVKDSVRKQDLVLTSGSGIFPAGYPIGRIEDPGDAGSLVKVATVRPLVNPYAVDELFLVRRAQPALDELTGVPPDVLPPVLPLPVDPEEARLARREGRDAFAMPDSRSIQERYAP